VAELGQMDESLGTQMAATAKGKEFYLNISWISRRLFDGS